MPTWLKVVLALLLVCVLGVVALVGGLYYVGKKYGPQFVAGVEKGQKEGRDFGEQTDNQGCVDEGVARHRKAQGLTEMMKSSIFLQSCLQASRPTPHFCDDVPGPFEITKTIQWRKDQCQKYGMTGEQGCDQLFQQVQQFCVRHMTDEP
ncbi:MAG: hypothetical protein QOF61_1198 [Acidobacteriota bacterium]|jgi:hypothetical protein|nr:hypothetical protein [Acidobacteriota bacterium]